MHYFLGYGALWKRSNMFRKRNAEMHVSFFHACFQFASWRYEEQFEEHRKVTGVVGLYCRGQQWTTSMMAQADFAMLTVQWLVQINGSKCLIVISSLTRILDKDETTESHCTQGILEYNVSHNATQRTRTSCGEELALKSLHFRGKQPEMIPN